MRYYESLADLASFQPSEKGYAAALGNFDGVHIGHQAVLRRCTRIGQELHLTPIAITFDPHPVQFFAAGAGLSRGASHRLILPPVDKYKLLLGAGVDEVWVIKFCATLAKLEAGDFISMLQRAGVKAIVTGKNFRFGCGRSGDAGFLAAMAANSGGELRYHAEEDVVDGRGGQVVVSSSYVKQALCSGWIATAARLLGRYYSAEVGRERVRGEGFIYPPAGKYLCMLQGEGHGYGYERPGQELVQWGREGLKTQAEQAQVRRVLAEVMIPSTATSGSGSGAWPEPKEWLVNVRDLQNRGEGGLDCSMRKSGDAGVTWVALGELAEWQWVKSVKFFVRLLP